MNKPITILGGGLAGLTLGIGLRQRGIPVTVLESGHYPRHRVCGEFISGGGQQSLARLGLFELLLRAGAKTASTAAFFLPNQADAPIRDLEQAALCLSRFRLDALLADHFRKVGGDLQENIRASLNDASEGVIRASGRRPHPTDNGTRWFGLKIHARSLPLMADLEMHVFEHGYVGLCRLPDNEVNICGLFRRPNRSGRREENQNSKQESHKQGLSKRHSFPFPIPASCTLHHRLSAADLDNDSFCSIAGLSLRPQRAVNLPEVSLGDALTMTPPVTGNGMSMAFESAEIAIEPLSQYSRGEISWAVAREQIARACDARFSSRLRWAKWLQWMMFSPLFQRHVGSLALCSRLLWNIVFRQTRCAGHLLTNNY